MGVEVEVQQVKQKKKKKRRLRKKKKKLILVVEWICLVEMKVVEIIREKEIIYMFLWIIHVDIFLLSSSLYISFCVIYIYCATELNFFCICICIDTFFIMVLIYMKIFKK